MINPKSIVVIGASNDLKKAGGKMLHNIIKGGFSGDLIIGYKRKTVVKRLKR